MPSGVTITIIADVGPNTFRLRATRYGMAVGTLIGYLARTGVLTVYPERGGRLTPGVFGTRDFPMKMRMEELRWEGADA